MQHLLLLHGAMGAAVQMKQLAAALEDRYTVHALNFAGHGGTALPADPFSMDGFVQQVLDYVTQAQLQEQPLSIFGYSMGGYVAMRLAQQYPQQVSKVSTLATKYHWDEVTAAKEGQLLQPEKIKEKVPRFAGQLQQLHGEGWEIVMTHTAALLQSLGSNNILAAHGYENISTPALLLLGDRDAMVSLDETTAVYRQLPAGQLGLLPATPHPFDKVDVQLLATLLHRFFNAYL